MNTEKLFSENVLRKPETKRASRSGTDVDLTKLMRLGWNENPYGKSPKALEANRKAAETSYYYQDFWNRELKETIAEKYGVKTSNVIVGAGSSPLIEIVGQTFLNPGDEVIMCPTFAAFIDMVDMRMGKVVMVPLLEDKTYNLDGILEAITDKTKMIIVCNPNNPTGTYVGYQKMVDFMKKVPDDVLVFFDEAYIEFATAEDCRSVYPFIYEMPEKAILVMRTFSKYYAMAGSRCGYILTSDTIAEGIGKVPGSWVSSAAQAEAKAALEDEEFYENSKAKIIRDRKYMEKVLEQLGCTVYKSQTNFIMFDPHCNPEDVRDFIVSKGILISTPMYCRVSIGKPEENEIFLGYLREFLEAQREKEMAS